jgi:hypothetical protein
MTSDRFLYPNKKILSSLDNHPLGLANGKMGLCIYFYHLSRLENIPEYEKVAEDILDHVIENITKYQSINVESGLAGVAIGLDHLIKEKFVNGDINDILGEVDDKIFKAIAFEEESIFKEIAIHERIHLLYYFYIRYTAQTHENEKFIFGELIKMTVESIYQNITSAFFDEPLACSLNYHFPVFLYMTSRILSLNIYNERIHKILDEYKLKLSGNVPVSHANRLMLLWGLACISRYYNTSELTAHIELLRKNIDVNFILEKELKNMQVFFLNGVSFICFLLIYLKRETPENAIEFDPGILYDRIDHSEIWEDMEKEAYTHGILNGTSGVLLTLSILKKMYQL